MHLLAGSDLGEDSCEIFGNGFRICREKEIPSRRGQLNQVARCGSHSAGEAIAEERRGFDGGFSGFGMAEKGCT